MVTQQWHVMVSVFENLFRLCEILHYRLRIHLAPKQGNGVELITDGVGVGIEIG